MATESKHTPGKWLVEPINGGLAFQITSAESFHFSVIAETAPDGTGRDEANARLIAAAPEMYEALQDLIRICEAVRHTVGLGKGQLERIEKARAALGKAEGK